MQGTARRRIDYRGGGRVEGRRVFDGELFIRELKAERQQQRVSIGARIGTAPAREEALERMRAYLRGVPPEGPAWDEASFESVVEAVEKLNRETDASRIRLMRWVAVAVALGIAIWWWHAR